MCKPQNDANTNETAVAVLAAEVERLRGEVEKLKHERNRAGKEARKEMMDGVEAMRSALDHIATYGGSKTETEYGTIHHNGSWCAEQARCALYALPVRDGADH